MPAPDGTRSESFRILVVEDDLASREWLSRALIKKGYEVMTAVNGEEALAKARQSRFHASQFGFVSLSLSHWSAMRALVFHDRAQPSGGGRSPDLGHKRKWKYLPPSCSVRCLKGSTIGRTP